MVEIGRYKWCICDFEDVFEFFICGGVYGFIDFIRICGVFRCEDKVDY